MASGNKTVFLRKYTARTKEKVGTKIVTIESKQVSIVLGATDGLTQK